MSTNHPSPGAAVILDRERALTRTRDLLAYIDASPMPYHAVAESVLRLRAAGYSELREADAWTLQPGNGYYVVRAGASLIAFRVGREAPSAAGVAAFGAHVDSPNLRVKPKGEAGVGGYRQLAVDVYGGVLLATWTDRDLGLAGRVVLRGSSGPAGNTEERLVTLRRPIARVPNLAIHLNRDANKDGLTLDKQRHMPPVIGLHGPFDDWSVRGLLAAELDVDPDTVVDYDLGLFDVVPCTIGGCDEEFVFAPRLDNLGCSHAGLAALIAAGAAGERTRLIVLYDHEECGSSSAQGAAGSFLLDVLSRLSAAHPGVTGPAHEEAARAVARSFLVSADMAHALHPNYAEMHEPGHRPMLNRGPAIKRNDNQRYATDGETGGAFAAYCRDAGFEPQWFVSRSDLPCGSTIGPISAARTGLRTVDVGNPMLSMHSIREMAGAWDQDLLIEALLRHFR